MDRMPVCGTCDPGSIPGESTSTKKRTLMGAFFVRALTAKLGKLCVRNRSPIELDYKLAK
jgi:hypothetical protein